MSTVTMREMLEAGVHFGHQTRFWDPKMEPYLFGQRNKIHIINLEKSLPLFNEALNFASRIASRKGTILFVGTKRSAQKIIHEEAERCGMPYINRRWLGGLLTNYKTVKQSINRLKQLESMFEDGSTEKVSKKEALGYQRELDKLKSNLDGIKDMKGLPDVLFIVDVGYEDIAVSEAVKLGIPVIGVVDSNNSPNGVDYLIPGNDDAIRSIRLYASGIAGAVIDGRGSVAHLGGDGDTDDFVELDESGTPMSGEPGTGRRGTAKKAAAGKKTTARQATRKTAEAVPEAPEEAGAEPANPVIEEEPGKADTAKDTAGDASADTSAAADAATAAKAEAGDTAETGPAAGEKQSASDKAGAESTDDAGKAETEDDGEVKEAKPATKKKTKKKAAKKKTTTKKKTTKKKATKKKTTAKKKTAKKSAAAKTGE